MRITRISVKGFKSLEAVDLHPGQLNVMIGPNGAGKSNLIAFFRLLSWCVSSVDRLQEHIAALGFASNILFEGPERTKEIEGHIEIETQQGWNEYFFRLSYTSGDQLFFAEEKVRFSSRDYPDRNPRWVELGFGHRESKLNEWYSSDPTVRVTTDLLRKVIVYQFHNTTATAQIRNRWSTQDGRWLKENGANLGSFLYRLKQEESAYYVRYVRYLRQVLPFFDDFVLEEDHGNVLLRWKEQGSARIFAAGVASDGMLRFMALAAVLTQPPADLPHALLIDEPELGLHPAALVHLAGLIKKAMAHTQIWLATQSVGLVNEFSADDILVVERDGLASRFHRQSAERLAVWLQEYSLGELFENNVMGGRP